MEGADADAKRSKPLRTRSKCPPSSGGAEREGGRIAQQVHVTPPALQIFGACPRLLSSRQVCLFLAPAFVETSVLSAHQFEAAFPLPASEGKDNQREKSMYPQALKKSIASIGTIFRAG